MTAALSSDPHWDDFRRQMPVARQWVYFDHAAISPLPTPAAEAIRGWARQAEDSGGTVWLQWKARKESARTLAATLLNAAPEEIALVRSTTEGINLVAEGFPWQRGDNVVAFADEFPANLYPWMNQAHRGVETRHVPVENFRPDLDRLAAACDGRTRIVALSWVGYASAWRFDLAEVAELAHRRGALLFVDAIQGLGAFPLDVRRTGIDFLAAGAQKWLLAPEAVGLFYIRRELIDRLHPIGVGASSVVHAGDYTRIELDLKPPPPASKAERAICWATLLSPPRSNCCSGWAPKRSASAFWPSPTWPVAALAKSARRSSARASRRHTVPASCSSICRAAI